MVVTFWCQHLVSAFGVIILCQHLCYHLVLWLKKKNRNKMDKENDVALWFHWKSGAKWVQYLVSTT